MSKFHRLLHPSKPPPVQARGVIHELVAVTAKEMCRTFYEEAAHDNDFYRTWPTSDDFLVRRWHSFIQPAREHLADLLHPDKHSLTTEDQRRLIHEALLKNAAVNPAINAVDQMIKDTSHPVVH